MNYEMFINKKLDKIDTLVAKLNKERQRIFIEYIQYLGRKNNPQTDLCDFIKEQEYENTTVE